ncbi:unnamed protein product [Cuscuta campestris]|uniref:Glycosyl transferase 48 domain-containing protein n=1 Tax=Cuscuta campestris TaxID=132261 RepID=A0A484MPD0_9ASTE|nr:unnamed protein product [Cuscuta campestris]
MMYYRKALMLQAYLERVAAQDSEAVISPSKANDTQGFELSLEARAQVDLKFTYVVTCQIYGKQKENQKPEAADIALLMQRNEALRVAFIDEVETLIEGKVHEEYFSKLVKADINGKDMKNLQGALLCHSMHGFYVVHYSTLERGDRKSLPEIYSVKLPGNPKLGEGKPENQNHAIIFTQTPTADADRSRRLETPLGCRRRPPLLPRSRAAGREYQTGLFGLALDLGSRGGYRWGAGVVPATMGTAPAGAGSEDRFFGLDSAQGTITLDDNLSYEEEPILAREVKQLRNKRVPLVEVLWRNYAVEEATWETGDSMRTRYCHLSDDNDSGIFSLSVSLSV